MIRQPKCIACSGTGQVYDWRAFADERDFRRCEMCDGSGRVPIVTWIGQKIALWQFKRKHS